MSGSLRKRYCFRKIMDAVGYCMIDNIAEIITEYAGSFLIPILLAQTHPSTTIVENDEGRHEKKSHFWPVMYDLVDQIPRRTTVIKNEHMLRGVSQIIGICDLSLTALKNYALVVTENDIFDNTRDVFLAGRCSEPLIYLGHVPHDHRICAIVSGQVYCWLPRGYFAHFPLRECRITATIKTTLCEKWPGTAIKTTLCGWWPGDFPEKAIVRHASKEIIAISYSSNWPRIFVFDTVTGKWLLGALDLPDAVRICMAAELVNDDTLIVLSSDNAWYKTDLQFLQFARNRPPSVDRLGVWSQCKPSPYSHCLKSKTQLIGIGHNRLIVLSLQDSQLTDHAYSCLEMYDLDNDEWTSLPHPSPTNHSSF